MKERLGSAIERMQDVLYSRKQKTGIRPRSELAGNILTEGGWKKPEGTPEPVFVSAPKKPFMSLASFVGLSFLFFLIAVGVAGYTFFYGGNIVSQERIGITVLGPSLIDGGKEALFQITIENRNSVPLELADLIVEYPEGTRSPEDVRIGLPQERITIGTIAPGERVKKTARAILFGQEGSEQGITATLEYRVQGSNAVFLKEEPYAIRIGASPVAVSVIAPDEAVSGERLSFEVVVRGNSEAPIKNLVLQAEYPFGFSLETAEPETAIGDRLWRLGDLGPGEEKRVKIVGVLTGQDNEERIFRFLTGGQENPTDVTIKVPYITVPHALTIKRPFIGGSLAINGVGGQTVSVSSGETVTGSILWNNNLDTEVQDLEIVATLEGQALSPSSVTASRGFYRSSDSSVVWNKETDSSFASVAPGASGEVTFSFVPKAVSNAPLTNPELRISVRVGARRTTSDNVPQSIESAFSGMIRVGSALSIAASTKYGTGGIQNGGPLPPRVNQQTTYTVVWTVRNPSNTVSNTKATATLPPYVRFTGATTPSSESLTYSQSTNTVTWSLGDVKAGVGYTAAARQVSFQVALVPSISQLGSVPALTGRITVSGDDRFTGGKAESAADPATTQVTGEASFNDDMSAVVE